MNRPAVIFLAQAFGYFVIIKLVDWVVAGTIVDELGPTRGLWAHAAVYGAAMLAFAAWGIARLRDRFSVLVALGMIAIPLATWAIGALAN